QWARDQDLEQLQDDVVQSDRDFIDEVWIPEEFDEQMRRFSQRTFLNMRTGTDRESGAIVASVSRQPSYQLDWPRDGAFFNIALDLAGQHDLVSKRMDFYSEAIRDDDEEPVPLLNEPVPGWPDNENSDLFPADSWEMNYYADGDAGGNIRLEIDNTALLVWSYVYHVGHLEGDERDEYIEDVWPTVERAAEWLHFWRDEETGLNWYANEDDHIQYTQGLQGSSTTYGALVSAARLARYIGEDELADKWLERAGELKAATVEHMYVEGEGFRGHPDPDEPGAGSPHWLGWPTRMVEEDDERYLPQLRSGLEKHLEDVRGETAGGQYPTKVAISGALVLDDEGRDDAYEIADRLATDIANPNTYTLGEHYSSLDADGDGETDGWVNSVSTPHLWSMALVYLTAVAYHHPERFDAYDDVLPEVEVPEVDPPGTGGDAGDAGDAADAGADAGQEQPRDTVEEGCGCRSTPSGVPGEWVVFGLVVLWWRRER
ncbi:MAG: MYXO-CTERM sorting domain-containing protein, partial [Persicimonas sp.]